MDQAPWWGMALIGVLGIVVGAFAEHLRSAAQFRREVAREEARERLERGEEAYRLLQCLKSEIDASVAASVVQVMSGDSPALPDVGNSFKRLELLVRMYLPELVGEFETYLEAQEQIVARVVMGEEVRSKVGRTTRLTALRSISRSYSEATVALAAGIARSSRGDR